MRPAVRAVSSPPPSHRIEGSAFAWLIWHEIDQDEMFERSSYLQA
jgi:hypothetical protein